MRCLQIFAERMRECYGRAERFPCIDIRGEKTEPKHMEAEWLSQAQDKHLTLVVQRLSSYTSFMYY